MAFGLYLEVESVSENTVKFSDSFIGESGMYADSPNKRYLGATMKVVRLEGGTMPEVGDVADPKHPLDVFGRQASVEVEWV